MSGENDVRASRTTYKVRAENLDRLRDSVAAINKRVTLLRRRGYDVSPVEVKVGELFAEKKVYGRDLNGEVVEREDVFAAVELLSPKPPRVDGWEFVAALTHVEEAGTVLRVCPGAAVAEGELRKYRAASPENCDHCHARRKRSDTFVLRDRGGELRQVGRQCLAAYTGLACPEALCAAAEVLFAASDALCLAEDDDEEGLGGGCGGRRYCTVASYLPYVACSIRADGWLSRTAARESGAIGQSTADRALTRGIFASPDCEHKYVPSEADYNLASAALRHCEEYFAGRDVDSLSDYESSLRVAVSSPVVHPKLVGLVASAIGFYQRDLEKRVKQEAWAAAVGKSTFQGKPGERRVFEGLKVLTCRTWSSDYGVTYFYSLVDDSGNLYAYFASRDMELQPGQEASLLATVKKHELRTPQKAGPGAPTYQQTVLTRCQLAARARVESCEAAEVYLGKMEKTDDPAYSFGVKQVFEKIYRYHLVGADGRRFSCQLRSRKRAMVPGASFYVAYGDASASGEQPASVVGPA